jgi:hypothetical protein
MSNLKALSSKQARIQISALQGIFWTALKGGKSSREEVKYNDGAQGLELTLAGMTSVEPLTLTKPYDPVNDAALQNFLTAQRANATPFNISITPVNSDVAGSAMAGARPITYNNCTLLGYTPPQFDRDGTGLAKCEIVVAVNSLPTY